MNCPNCQEARLTAYSLEENLNTLVCGHCSGQWVQSFQYWKWLDSHGNNLPEKPVEDTATLVVEDVDHARVCPECSTILMRCRVGHGIDFYLDRCTNCGGIWFDKNEWEVLKSRNLHDDVHFVFSKSWQDRVIQDERRTLQMGWFVDQFGAEKFEEIKKFKAWLDGQEHRSAVIGFLS